MNHLVIAANNNEDTSWAASLPRDEWAVWANRTYHPPGREAYSYLDHIIFMGVPRATDDLILCQGNPFDHAPNFMEELEDSSIRSFGPPVECDPNGYPNDKTPLHEWSRILGLPTRELYRFSPGSHYRVSGEQVAGRDKRFYLACYYLTMIEGNRAAWALERLWPIIFGIPI